MSKEELKDHMASVIKEEIEKLRKTDFSTPIPTTQLEIEKKKIELELIKDQLERVEDMLDTYVCPITAELLINPVMAEDGQTYEQTEITKWFKTHDTSPITRKKIGKKVTINYKAKSTIAELQDQKNKLEARVKELTKP